MVNSAVRNELGGGAQAFVFEKAFVSAISFWSGSSSFAPADGQNPRAARPVDSVRGPAMSDPPVSQFLQVDGQRDTQYVIIDDGRLPVGVSGPVHENDR